MLPSGRGCSSKVPRLDTEEEAEPRGAAGLRLKESPLCATAHCLSPHPAPRRAEETSGAWPAEFLSFFLASSCHVAPDHGISVPCCQCLGLRRMSVYPGPLAKKQWCPEPAGTRPCPVSRPPSHDRAVSGANLQVVGQAQDPSPERVSASALPPEGKVQAGVTCLAPLELSDQIAQSPAPGPAQQGACRAVAHRLFLESYQVHGAPSCLFPPVWGHYRDPVSAAGAACSAMSSPAAGAATAPPLGITSRLSGLARPQRVAHWPLEVQCCTNACPPQLL